MEIPLHNNHDLFDFEQLPILGGIEFPVQRLDFTLLRGSFYLALTELHSKWDYTRSMGCVDNPHEAILKYIGGLLQ